MRKGEAERKKIRKTEAWNEKSEIEEISEKGTSERKGITRRGIKRK